VCLLKHENGIDFSYNPHSPSILENYEEISILSQLALSPAVISLCIEDESDLCVVKKAISKEKLFGEIE